MTLGRSGTPDVVTTETTISKIIHPIKFINMKQKNLITVVTDHELTADTIARAIGANEKHDGYYLGNGYAVTWTNGGVIESIYTPDESFVMSSSMDMRLMYAHNFKFRMRDIDELVGYKKSAQDKKQLATIKALWKMSHTVVNAMRPAIDGELDFLNLYYYLAIPAKVRRAWLPVLTKGTIRHAVQHGPTDRKEYEEWLQGELINTFLHQISERMQAVIEMPVEEIKENLTEEELTEVRESLKNAIATLEDSCAGVESVDLKENERYEDGIIFEISEGAHLFNAILLELHAEDELGFDMAKTKQLAINLYAKKLISYPLVVQNGIPFGVWRKMCHNKEILRYNGKWGNKITPGKPSRRHNFRNGECIYNGFGIVTTGLHPTDLSRDEEKLYNLIVKSVIDAFA